MRSLRFLQSPREIAPNMTALVDVVMVILIFLMLAGTLVGDSRFLKSKSLVAASTHPAPSQDFVINVIISRASDGTAVINAGRITTQDPSVLSNELAADLRKYQAAGTKVGEIQVVLRPSPNVKYKDVIAVFEAACRAGYQRVSFISERRVSRTQTSKI